jgi:NADPH-dependent ferric siderophore reductase
VSTATTHELAVDDVATLTPLMRRVTFTGESLSSFECWPGQDVVLHLTDESGAGVRRRYTVREFDVGARRLSLDFVLHGHGPGARWAAGAERGARLQVFGPRGKVAMSDAGWQLYLGDESALPAIAEMAAALPLSARGVAIIEVNDANERQPIPGPLDVRWVFRDGAPAGTTSLLDESLHDLAVPDADRHAFVFGESRAVRRLRDALQARRFAPGELAAKGYWNVGRAMRD